MRKPNDRDLLRLFPKEGLMRAREVVEAGYPRWMLYQLVTNGAIVRTGRGMYCRADAAPTENHSYTEAIKRVPKGIICLLSALCFHGLTMQNPTEVWVAVPHGSWRSKSADLKIRTVQFSNPAPAMGIEMHQVEGVAVPVTNVARTIVDCFKFRNKIGIDVAIEALREGWGKKRFTMDELWVYVRMFRMTRVMMPYLESLA